MFILFLLLVLIIAFIICILRNSSVFNGGKELNSNVFKENDKMTMSYTISGEDNGLNFDELRLLLKENKYGATFVERPVTEDVHVSFGTFGNKFKVKGGVKRWNYDPLFFKQRAAIKNTLGEHHQIINKSELYNTMKRLIPNGVEYLPKSYTVKEMDTLFKNDKEILDINFPLIIKKDNVPQQMAIRLILSREEYYKAKKELDIKQDAMISSYITNPLTVDGRKFNLRIYYLLSVIGGITRCIPYHTYRIYTALEKYKKSDWFNKKIHLSGVEGSINSKRYSFPDDIKSEYPDHIDTIIKNLNNFNKILCQALSIANIINYPESYAGYHLYGMDVLITEDFHPYLLEVNSKPGFRPHAGWTNEYHRIFCKELFYFIFTSTIFPYLGLKRPPHYVAEYIGNGVLSQFGPVLTGKNRCILIPYLDAREEEINKAMRFHFYNERISLSNLMENCHLFDVFLIGEGKGAIIGYITLSKDNYLSIAVIEEFQNRSIATAIIAQLLEIYIARNINKSDKGKKIYIKKNNIFLSSIAKKLHFIENKKNEYEKSLKMHDNYNIDKIMKGGLTYKLINDDTHFDTGLILPYIDKYMVVSNSQFVNFAFNILPSNEFSLKHSTGSRYNKTFIYQGAELKSSLDCKILFSIYAFKSWYYKMNLQIGRDIFDRRIPYGDKNLKYIIYDYINDYNFSEFNSEKFNSEKFNSENYLIEEHHPPFLLDGKLMALRCYLSIYISGNGIAKCHHFNKMHVVCARDKYLIDKISKNMISKNMISTRYSGVNKTYNWPNDFKNGELSHIANNETILNTVMKKFLDIVMMSDIKPYNESNSGFLECAIDIKFIKKEEYIPILHRIFNRGVHRLLNNVIYENFIKKYYQWLFNSIIMPHFGLLSKDNFIMPFYVARRGKINHINMEIIKGLFLCFNHERNIVNIYINMEHIGHINLNLSDIRDNIIELKHIELGPTYRKKNIAIGVIFILMETLAAYYAPRLMSLIFKFVKQMHLIAYNLSFQKMNNDFYIKKCR